MYLDIYIVEECCLYDTIGWPKIEFTLMLGKRLEKGFWQNVEIIRDVINMDSEEILSQVDRKHTHTHTHTHTYIYIM
jgi:hypothetical protein